MARRERVAQAIKEDISSIIHDELNDPRVGFVTITRVDLAPDLRYARIFYSVLGREEDMKKTREALESSKGFIQKLLAQRMKLRFATEIAFKEDRSCEYSVQIQKILQEIEEEDELKKGSRLHKKKQ